MAMMMAKKESSEVPDFETQMETKRQDDEYSELPGLDISMWPEDIGFQDDLSESRYYNDIFIEQRVDKPSGIRYITKIFFFSHNVSVYFFLEKFFSGVGFDLLDVLVLLICPLFAWLFFFIEFFTARFGGARFNRQAQLVHVGGLGGVVSLPWREVKPFFNHGVHGGDLRLYFPYPEERVTYGGGKTKYERYGDKEPFVVQGTLDWRDIGIDGSLLRLEFYRRFMEEGFEAVQPDPEKVGQKAIRPPSEAQQSGPEDDGILWVLTKIAKLGGILAGGPLIDLAIRKQAQKFKWPEEIERLCSPGADLSGIDTTPVKPRKDIFYRPCGLDGIELVNARGQRIG